MAGNLHVAEVKNQVLREILEEIRQDKEKRVAFPFWGNWSNWGRHRHWRNWTNWHNWYNWWT
jgi:hypothetical protein